MFSEGLFWDGRVDSLKEQAKQPLTNPFEMGMQNDGAIVARISGIREYRQSFRQIFGGNPITIEKIVKSIAAYERTQLSGNSPFDRFVAGSENAVTEAQERGWELFKGKANCVECHTYSNDSPFFTDFKFYNTGIASKAEGFENLSRRAKQVDLRAQSPDMAVLSHDPKFSDLGRFLVTRRNEDIGAFKRFRPIRRPCMI